MNRWLGARNASGSRKELTDFGRFQPAWIVTDVALGEFERRDSVELVADGRICSVRYEVLDDSAVPSARGEVQAGCVPERSRIRVNSPLEQMANDIASIIEAGVDQSLAEDL